MREKYRKKDADACAKDIAGRAENGRVKNGLMISFLDGVLEEMDRESVTINVGGIGFSVFMGAAGLSSLPSVGSRVKLHTWFQVREDGMSLFGFRKKEELELFKKIISVSGVGPKGALGILSVFSPEDFVFSIAAGDAKRIAKAPGIGKRTAERLILELKDKVSAEEALAELGKDPLQTLPPEEGILGEAISALVALGYSRAEAAGALKGIEEPETKEVQELLQLAFRQLM